MTFTEVKELVLNKARKRTVCGNYVEALSATTYSELLTAAGTLIDYLYNAEIVTDELLGEVSESTLNSYGVYSTGSFSLTNPSATKLYILKNAVVNLTLNGNNKIDVFISGGATLNLTSSSNSNAKIQARGQSVVNITHSNYSSSCIDCDQDSEVVINLNNNSTTHINANGKSVLNIELNHEDTFARTVIKDDSILNYEGIGEIQIFNTDRSQVNAPLT